MWCRHSVKLTLLIPAVVWSLVPLPGRADAVYFAKEGDTLARIAAVFDTRQEDLRARNGLTSDSVNAGDRISIPEQGLAAAFTADVEGQAGAPKGALVSSDVEPPRAAEACGPCLPPAEAIRAVEESGAREGEAAPGFTARLLEFARSLINVPYRFGGSTLKGIDCSAYVQKVFAFLDIRIPRTAREQYRLGRNIGRGDLEAGDLVFFQTYARYASHVGIYLGNNRFIHASSRDRKVTVDDFDAPYYARKFLGGRRLIEPQGGPQPTADKGI